MNIKSLQSILPSIDHGVSKVDPLSRKVKSESSNKDRDAYGRQEGGHSSDQRPMTEEEFQEALEILKNLPGFKSHNLRVEIKDQGSTKVLYLKDPSGQVVKRFVGTDLWSLLKDRTRKVGQILDKSI